MGPALLALLLLASCGGGGSGGGGGGGALPLPASTPAAAPAADPASTPSAADGAAAPPAQASATTSLPAASPAPDPADLAARAAALSLDAELHALALLPSGWTGNVTGCTPGDMAADYRAAILRSINAYRALAGLPAVVDDPVRGAGAQQAALMIRAQNALSHSPTPDWACYTEAAAQAAGSSDIALGYAGAGAIHAYMADVGHADLGHRRWLLFGRLASVGIGDSGRSNAVWVLDQWAPVPADAAVRNGVAWPPPGYVAAGDRVARPEEAWSFSLPDADFTAAQVSLLNDRGETLALVAQPLPPDQGDPGISWTIASAPGSWQRAPADTRFTVHVSGVRVGTTLRSFDYRVVFVTPPG